jgi:hypothetical protein
MSACDHNRPFRDILPTAIRNLTLFILHVKVNLFVKMPTSVGRLQFNELFWRKIGRHGPDRGLAVLYPVYSQRPVSVALDPGLEKFTFLHYFLLEVNVLDKLDGPANPYLNDILRVTVVEAHLHVWIYRQLFVKVFHLAGMEYNTIFIRSIKQEAPDVRLAPLNCSQMENRIGIQKP